MDTGNTELDFNRWPGFFPCLGAFTEAIDVTEEELDTSDEMIAGTESELTTVWALSGRP